MASPPPLLTLTDELLEEIFLRLPGPTDLARASTACASFHRVITDRAFLRRFRGIHPPPLLGFVPRGQDGFYPAQPPYHSAPLARAVADAADFSYYFVPIGRWLKPWRPRDLRQGRVLLECLPKYDERYHFHSVVFLSDLDLAVCDPLHRRYVLLPPVPHKITAQHGLLVDFDAFLAPTGQDEEGTSFQVICTARNETNLFAIVFSSVTGHWCIAASPSWSCLGTEVAFDKLAYPDYANGCFYWTQDWFGKLLMLDATKMEFSIVNSVPSSNLIEGNINSVNLLGNSIWRELYHWPESIGIPSVVRLRGSYSFMAFQKVSTQYAVVATLGMFQTENIFCWMSRLLNLRRSVR
ncbi:uncharacterized protein LOC101771292 isoform X2 [Setaria italica]|uniref:uncharacterized protein LOC101771292 isoform X2 n=1 Tax=Setaria italica TaxID=4555 RepID=UPI000350EC33|nr:uncharacterized protein LOC101771292 isoform X2 [Setaria italica]